MIIERLRRLSPARRAVVAAFALAALASLFFGTRFVVHAIYWSSHRDEPIAGWMTVGYVSHSYDVPPALLREALGAPAGTPDRRPIAEIASSLGLTTDEALALLREAIMRARSEAAAAEDEAAP